MLALNTQVAEKRIPRKDGSLDVHSVFYTIQGEGPFAGVPAVFVRLAGCNLQCPHCDTEYTRGRRTVDANLLMVEVHQCSSRVLSPLKLLLEDSRGLVVLTGGEPLRQSCGPFVMSLLEAKFNVQIETNGTLYDDSLEGIYADISVVCSPKTPKIDGRLIPVIDDYKYILTAGEVSPADGLPARSLGMVGLPARPHPGFAGDVFIQPQDDQDPYRNKANVQAAVASCMKYGYRMSIQQHKILELE